MVPSIVESSRQVVDILLAGGQDNVEKAFTDVSSTLKLLAPYWTCYHNWLLEEDVLPPNAQKLSLRVFECTGANLRDTLVKPIRRIVNYTELLGSVALNDNTHVLAAAHARLRDIIQAQESAADDAVLRDLQVTFDLRDLELTPLARQKIERQLRVSNETHDYDVYLLVDRLLVVRGDELYLNVRYSHIESLAFVSEATPCRLDVNIHGQGKKEVSVKPEQVGIRVRHDVLRRQS